MKESKLNKILQIVRKNINEEIPTNNASSGNIAGLPPDQPPVPLKRKYATNGKNSRKPWLDYLKKYK